MPAEDREHREDREDREYREDRADGGARAGHKHREERPHAG